MCEILPMEQTESKIRQYRKSIRQEQKEFAAFLGISISYLSELETGSRKPGRTLAVLIEKKTGGAVKPSDWDSSESPALSTA